MLIIEKVIDLKAAMLAMLYFIGLLANKVITQLQTASSWSELILGPFGALALSVFALYFLWKYMQKKDDAIRKIRESQLADKEKQIEKLEAEIKELKRGS